MYRVYKITVVALIGLFLGLSCSDDGKNEGPDGGDNHTPGGAGKLEDVDPNNICDEARAPIGDLETKVMLLQDISSSMNETVGGATKWAIAQDALTGMVNQFDDTVHFGLDFFPTSPNCTVGDVVKADAKPNNAANLSNILATTTTSSSTPLLLAMNNFLDESYAPLFLGAGSDPYLVVVSDGMDSCGAGGQSGGDVSNAELAAVTGDLLDQGIKTFVIGFGSGVEPGQLNAIAGAGGTPFESYFDAQNEQELNDALDSIGQTVIVSCRYQLGEVSEDADRDLTNIYFDGEGLVRGDECGGEVDWHWGNAEQSIVEFCPAACEMLENNEVQELKVIILCSSGGVIVV